MKASALAVPALVAAFCLVAAGCTPTASTSGPGDKAAEVKTEATPTPAGTPPPIDTSTPDLAVKSFWAYADYISPMTTELGSELEAKQIELYKTQVMPLYAVYSKMLSGPAADRLIPTTKDVQKQEKDQQQRRSRSHQQRYDREIIEVKQETASRAVVFVRVKNAVPIPPDVKLSIEDSEKRRTGEEFRYILEKSADGWKIVNIREQENDYEHGGKKWGNRYSTPTEDNSPSVFKYVEVYDTFR